MTETLNRAPTGDSARGPGVDETPGPPPLTRRRPESSTPAHITPASRLVQIPAVSEVRRHAQGRRISPTRTTNSRAQSSGPVAGVALTATPPCAIVSARELSSRRSLEPSRPLLGAFTNSPGCAPSGAFLLRVKVPPHPRRGDA